jgi:hypothetical protein
MLNLVKKKVIIYMRLLLVPLVEVALLPIIFVAGFLVNETFVCDGVFYMFLDPSDIVSGISFVFLSHHKFRRDIFNSNVLTSFHYKMGRVKDGYYRDRFFVISSVESYSISLFGLEFKFDHETQTFLLSGRFYDAIDFICKCDTIFRVMASIKDRGYVRLTYLENTFITDLTNQLLQFGYKTNTMNIFINLFFKTIKLVYLLSFYFQSLSPFLSDLIVFIFIFIIPFLVSLALFFFLNNNYTHNFSIERELLIYFLMFLF